MINSNVTVVIPCFNDGLYIKQAVNSILEQTLPADRIIVIDDGSSAETKSVLKELGSKDVEVIFQDNQGVCKARNNAIKLVETEFILTLDADDYFEPTFIEKALDILNNHSEAGIVGCYFRSFNENNIKGKVVETRGGTLNNFLYYNSGLGNAIFRKICWKQVQGYDEKMIHGYEDWEFWIAITSMGWEMKIIPEVLFNYRIKKASRDKTAKSLYDIELKRYIFNKHKELYAQNIEETISFFWGRIERITLREAKTKKSIDYRIGKVMLSPIRWGKGWINRLLKHN